MAGRRKSGALIQLFFPKGIILTLVLAINWVAGKNSSTSLSSKPPHTHKRSIASVIGITVQEVREAPLFYDTFFPVIYEVDIPTWKSDDLKIQIPRNLSNSTEFCNNYTYSTDIWAQSICPVMEDLNVVLDEFAEKLKVFEKYNASITKLASRYSSCHKITPHFTNHIIDHIEMDLYIIQALIDCPLADIIHTKLNVPKVNKTNYDALLKKFIATHIAPKYRMTGYSKYAVSTNTMLAIHSAELLDYLLDTFRWSTSMTTCNTGRIPSSLVSQDILRKTLKEIRVSVANNSLNLTIPIEDISNYYKLPLADCVATTKNTYVIRVLVPLTKFNENYKMLELKAVPFLNLEAAPKTMICHHRSIEGTIVVKGKSKEPVARVKCEEAELCRVPAEGDRPLFSQCVISSIFNDTKGLLDSCHMTCVPYDASLLPFIKRIRSDQFVIVGKSSAEIAVNCKDQAKPLQIIDIPNNAGSVIVTLPCSCYLSHRSQRFHVEGECQFHLDVKPVRPLGLGWRPLQHHIKSHHRSDNTTVIANSTNTKETNSDSTTNSGGDDDDDEDNAIADSFTDYGACNSPVWPIYLAYILIIIGTALMFAAFFVIRNTYIRLGQLELACAKNSYQLEPQFHHTTSNSINESVY